MAVTVEKTEKNASASVNPPAKSDGVKKSASNTAPTQVKAVKKKAAVKETVKKDTPNPLKVKKSTTSSDQLTPKLAVVEVNGTQLLVQEGKLYEMDKLEGLKGDSLEIKTVLLYVDGENVKVGKPFVEGAVVHFKLDSQKRGDKLRVHKFKAKSRYRKTIGSRPYITRLEVVQIIG